MRGGVALKEFRSEIEYLLKSLRENGHEVFCAVEHEGWRIQNVDPVEAWRKDWSAVKDSDIAIFVMEDELSAGVQVEIGAALAWNKKVVFIKEGGIETMGWSNGTICKSLIYDIKVVESAKDLVVEDLR